MYFGLTLPPFGHYADLKQLAELARIAEDVGWDGFFIWDHLIFDPPTTEVPDIGIALAAIAMATKTIKFGALVTSLARRRPWKVARETVSLDILSNGRLVVGAGLGSPAERDFGTFHEETNDKIRAEKLDESLEILSGLWTGEAFSYVGKHHTIDEVTFLPKPIQQPSIPIWVGGGWR